MAIVFVVVDGRSRSISFIVRTVLILTEGRPDGGYGAADRACTCVYQYVCKALVSQ
jgi:hypothetical protein